MATRNLFSVFQNHLMNLEILQILLPYLLPNTRLLPCRIFSGRILILRSGMWNWWMAKRDRYEKYTNLGIFYVVFSLIVWQRSGCIRCVRGYWLLTRCIFCRVVEVVLKIIEHFSLFKFVLMHLQVYIDTTDKDVVKVPLSEEEQVLPIPRRPQWVGLRYFEIFP